MAVSKQRVKEVLSYKNEFGLEESKDQFDVEETTIKRYERRAKELDIVGLQTYSIPKVLLFDIETSPRVFYAWRAGKQYINHSQMIQDSAVITYSAKWLCDDEIIASKVTLEEARNREDKAIVQQLWDLFDEADVLIAHNLKGFDEPYLKTRFLTNGMPPPSPYRRVDTLKDFRKEGKEVSNKLEYLADKYGLHPKQDVNFELWEGSVNGDEDSLNKMLEYNKQDVRALEDIYLKIRPWIKSHPNMALYYDDVNARCPNCGARDLKLSGEYYTNANHYDALRCSNCGAYGRRRHTNLHEDDKHDMAKPIAR